MKPLRLREDNEVLHGEVLDPSRFPDIKINLDYDTSNFDKALFHHLQRMNDKAFILGFAPDKENTMQAGYIWSSDGVTFHIVSDPKDTTYPAALINQHTLEHLDTYIQKMAKQGITVVDERIK